MRYNFGVYIFFIIVLGEDGYYKLFDEVYGMEIIEEYRLFLY